MTPTVSVGTPPQADPADRADRPTGRGGRVVVYPERLWRNAVRLRRAYGPRLIAVVKADGYGLDAATCAPALVRAGIHMIAVGSLAEAHRIRAFGAAGRLIILDATNITADDDVEWLVGRIESERLITTPHAIGQTRIHVDVDFGLGRGGVPTDEADEMLAALVGHPAVTVVGLAGHLPASPSEAAVRCALATLNRLRRRAPNAIVHIGGSDVLRWHQIAAGAWIRLGRPLFGLPPRFRLAGRAADVTPAWAWQATATALQPPAAVGYRGAPPPAGTPVRLDVGYADGLPPQAAGRWPVLVDGHLYLVHEVFMLSSLAYPADGSGLAPGTTAVALLSGRCGRHEVSARRISTALGIPSTAALTCPRSPREEAP